jgi:hypothetical protein
MAGSSSNTLPAPPYNDAMEAQEAMLVARERARHVNERAEMQRELEQAREERRQAQEDRRQWLEREKIMLERNEALMAEVRQLRAGHGAQDPEAQNDNNAVGGGQPLAMNVQLQDFINLTLEESPPPSPPSPPAPPPPPPLPPPQTVEEQLIEWNRQADLQIAHGSYYTDWRTSLDQKDIGCVLEILKQDEPQNPTIVYAPERAGKSGAICCIVKAAQVAGKAVIIFCAPTKVAPVQDMVDKLHKAGFDNPDTGCKIAHTLGPANTAEWPSQEYTQNDPVVFVCALTTHNDLGKAAEMITNARLNNREVVAIADECDEIVMGTGGSWMEVDRRFDPANVGDYIREGAGVDEDQEQEIVEGVDENSPLLGVQKKQVAKAVLCFKKEIVPRVILFMVTATVSGILVDPLSVFNMGLRTRVLLVKISRNYIGISNFTIPENCRDYRPGMAGVGDQPSSILQENHGNLEMWKNFVAHANPYDGQCLPHAVDPNKEIELKGLIYITTTNRVNATGGITDLAFELSEYMERNHQQLAPSTLIISFVGTPHCILNGILHKFKNGTSLQQMYNKMEERYNDPDDQDVQICGSDPEQVCFTDAITHLVLLGYGLTRRAMTAAFSPADKPGTLVMPMYVIARSGKASKVDADSQRIMRAGGDTGEYTLPEDYQVWISCEPVLLRNLNSLRKAEEESLGKQAQTHELHFEFLHGYNVQGHGVADLKVTKAGLSLDGIGRGTGGYEAAVMLRGAVQKFEDYLAERVGLNGTGRGDGRLSNSTVKNYMAVVKQMMQSLQKGEGDQNRHIHLSEIVSFDTLDAFIQSRDWTYGDYFDAMINGRPGNITSAFRHLKEFSQTDDGASAITDAGRA